MYSTRLVTSKSIYHRLSWSGIPISSVHHLPRSQSSGKSSVLENLVARDFLPRGAGIVTRCPLVLQLINITTDEEYGEFLHHPGERFTKFTVIREEIERETARIAGKNKGIARQPIHLKIYSPHVTNLTLVDLPGLTKIPIGDQPTDIERQTKTLITDYISKPNSIILAVSPANVDLVNSESLKLAKEVDPEGKRTVGVVTKIDLMDAGTNALDILSGRVFHLRLGFIGVVNRSQQDINANKDIKKSLETEENFFSSHQAYRNIANRCGTKYLAKVLNHLLMNHIRERLPDIKSKLQALIGQTQQELSSYGDPQFSGKEHKGTTVLRLVTKFANDFNASVDGRAHHLTTSELSGGARIYYIFNSIFGTSLSSISPCGNLTAQDIRTAIRNSTGPRPSLFIPEIAFDLLVRPQIQRLESPSIRCVEQCYEELIKICNSTGSKELQRYPKLYAKTIETVNELLHERLGPTIEYVESLIAIQIAYINTNHPDFVEQLHGGGSSQPAMVTEALPEARPPHSHPPPLPDRKSKRFSKTSMSNGAIEGYGVPGGMDNKDNFMDYFFGAVAKGSSAVTMGDPRGTTLPRERLMSVADEGGRSWMDDGSSGLTEREEMETRLIRTLITNYFNITRKTIQDLVPKAVMHLLVDNAKESIQNRLVANLYRDAMLDELLNEDESIAAERQRCKRLLEVYHQAFQIISEAI